MGEVVSLVDRLRAQNNVRYVQDYPIFEGKVLSVPAEIISRKNPVTLLDYLPKGAEAPQADFLTVLNPDLLAAATQEMNSAIQRAVVPFSVNPDMVLGSDVRGYMDVINGHNAYVLEIVNTTSPQTRMASAFLGNRLGQKDMGFKYIVSLDD